MFLLQKFAIVKYDVYGAKICKRALRASIEGYLAVAASTPTYSSLAHRLYTDVQYSFILIGKSSKKKIKNTVILFVVGAFPFEEED